MLKYALWIVLLYAFYCGLLFVLQRRILFPRGLIHRAMQSESEIAGLEKIWLDAGYGPVAAWLMPPVAARESAPAPAMIFAHGNGELIDFWPAELTGFTRLGIAVLLVEYPGYGTSAGLPSQKSITRTFIAAYDELASRRQIDPSRIVFFGRSLGGGAVCALARHRPAAALILLSTFTGVRPFAKRFLFPSFLVRDPFDNLAFVKGYPGPVLIGHGRDDEVIPFSHGRTLYEAAANGKMIVYEAGHNDCPPDWNGFLRDAADFLEDNGVIRPAGIESHRKP